MPRELVYVEPSALVKLVLDEPETAPLSRALAAWPLQVSSIVSAVEVPRAAWRETGSRDEAARAAQLVGQLDLIPLDGLGRAAAEVGPPTLRSLDAVHLASALSLGDDLGVFVTYDGRLAQAASETGLEVLSPQ